MLHGRGSRCWRRAARARRSRTPPRSPTWCWPTCACPTSGDRRVPGLRRLRPRADPHRAQRPRVAGGGLRAGALGATAEADLARRIWEEIQSACAEPPVSPAAGAGLRRSRLGARVAAQRARRDVSRQATSRALRARAASRRRAKIRAAATRWARADSRRQAARFARRAQARRARSEAKPSGAGRASRRRAKSNSGRREC